MSEPTQVFIVTSGEYSDYQINSAHLTAEEARAAAGEWGRIEVYPLGDNEQTLGTFSYWASIDPATMEVALEGDQPSVWPDYEPESRVEVLYWLNGGGSGLALVVTEPTRERAAKVYSEAKARVLNDLTLGLGPEDIADRIYDRGWQDNPRKTRR